MTGPVIATAVVAAVVEAKCMLEGVTEGVTNELVRFPRVDGVVVTTAASSLVGTRRRRGEEPASDGIDRVCQLKCPVIVATARATARYEVAPGRLRKIAPVGRAFIAALDGDGTAVDGTRMVVAGVPDLRRVTSYVADHCLRLVPTSLPHSAQWAVIIIHAHPTSPNAPYVCLGWAINSKSKAN